MSTLSVYLRLLIALSLCLALIEGIAAAQAQNSTRALASVQLKCRIMPEAGERVSSFWLLELRNAAGAPLRKVLRMAGETVRFSNLLPGIYRIYLFGKGGRSTSESVDLTPGPNQRTVEFIKDIKVPKTPPPRDQYLVSVRTLAVPKQASEEMQRADRCQLEGNEDGVIQHLKHAIEIYPSYINAWNNLGASYHRKGDYEKSIRSFTKVTELNPDFYAGWLNLGGSLLARGRFAEAAEASRKALLLRPDDAIANCNVGLSYYYLRDFNEAKKWLRRVLDLDPGLAISPHLYLAHIAITENTLDVAAGYLREYLALHPNAPDAAEVKGTLARVSQGIVDKD